MSRLGIRVLVLLLALPLLFLAIFVPFVGLVAALFIALAVLALGGLLATAGQWRERKKEMGRRGA
jgi:prepilin signal peptidase PulO-like enzyme (type II secretory pathway)